MHSEVSRVTTPSAYAGDGMVAIAQRGINSPELEFVATARAGNWPKTVPLAVVFSSQFRY